MRNNEAIRGPHIKKGEEYHGMGAISEEERSRDLEEYLCWQSEMDWRFEKCHYHEKEKVLFALHGLKDYASALLDKLTATRRRCGLELVRSWDKLKRVMRRDFVPRNYEKSSHSTRVLEKRPSLDERKLKKKQIVQYLLRLNQGSMNMEEFYKELKHVMRLLRHQGVKEDEPTKIGKFLKVLNKEIAQMVELHSYYDLEKKNLQRGETKKKPVVGNVVVKKGSRGNSLTNKRRKREFNMRTNKVKTMRAPWKNKRVYARMREQVAKVKVT
ncbi:hypothetical protein M9H77_23263 [Catharanthus roseus]|uniref:Uncharacterized protein n=1 Tax=Catharanthus roseus TaxID=4058 RepID=A0ACC0AST2_CATRO|nr:hypothetical protein M9H77_23263 [Catharanthus roseus]